MDINFNIYFGSKINGYLDFFGLIKMNNETN